MNAGNPQHIVPSSMTDATPDLFFIIIITITCTKKSGKKLSKLKHLLVIPWGFRSAINVEVLIDINIIEVVLDFPSSKVRFRREGRGGGGGRRGEETWWGREGMCVCVCVFVEREREREREREWKWMSEGRRAWSRAVYKQTSE